jgi:hypothetical protein
MAGMRMSMREIREVLRLTHELGLSVRQVCEANSEITKLGLDGEGLRTRVDDGVGTLQQELAK